MIASFKNDIVGQTTTSFATSAKVVHGDRVSAHAGVTTLYHGNQQYSVTALSDSSGNVSERYAYTAYGQPTFLNASGAVQASSVASNRYTYTGREWDATLGLHHFRARWMSGLSGRFLTRDPKGYKAAFNLFRSTFVFNGVDPTGNEGLSADDVSRTCDRVVNGLSGLKLSTICPASPFTFRLRCAPCGRGDQPGDLPPKALAVTECHSNPALIDVVLCNDRAAPGIDTEAKLRDSLITLVLHEWVHAGDYCNCKKGCDLFRPKKILGGNFEDWSDACAQYFCSEIRATHADGYCDGKATDRERRECFKQRMLQQYLPGMPTCKEANIDRAMDKCYQPEGDELTWPSPYF